MLEETKLRFVVVVVTTKKQITFQKTIIQINRDMLLINRLNPDNRKTVRIDGQRMPTFLWRED